jgi:hypothetical protein
MPQEARHLLVSPALHLPAKAQPLNMVRLSLSYGYPEHSWSLYDTMDTNREYSIHEIEEMLDYKKMAEREHKQTDGIKNMETLAAPRRSSCTCRLNTPRLDCFGSVCILLTPLLHYWIQLLYHVPLVKLELHSVKALPSTILGIRHSPKV